MPKAYSEKEKNEICASLRKYALEFIQKKGIKKTTVDDLVEATHIPKGTFYLLYESKEILIFDAITEQHDYIQNKLQQNFLQLKDNFTKESLCTFLSDSFAEGFNLGIIPLMVNGEFDVLIRKLPEEKVKEHVEKDDEFFTLFKYIFPNLNDSSIKKYSASFRAIFFTIMFKREIGDEFTEVINILIKGIVNQMWSENDDSNK